MRLAVLFSGGKDSALAMHKAMDGNEIACLISLLSENRESYMFHTPNIGMTKLQAEAMGLPLIQKVTKGVKEEELQDLKAAISEAKRRYNIEGVVTGAVESVYQSSRVQMICDELGLWCLNPLWLKDQKEILEELLSGGFKVMISGVFAHPLDRSWLGKVMDENLVEELIGLGEKYEISPAGEGGEIETTVLDAPFFRKPLEVRERKLHWEGDSGWLEVST